jgi:Rad3-related DNA helicase
MAKDILRHFPFETFRPYQKETILQIEEAFKSGKRFAVLDVQTGGGKSAIGLTHARHQQSAYILTPQKILQDQYMRDFGNEIVDLKGRNTYECVLANRSLTGERLFCHRGLCKQQGKSKLKECVRGEILCPYFKRLAEAKVSPIALFNFKSFLFQANYARQFGKRKLLIIDEAHNTESQLMDFVSISLSDRDFKDEKLHFPRLETPYEYRDYFRRIELEVKIEEKIRIAQRCRDTEAQNKWKELYGRYQRFVSEIDKHQFISEYRKVKGRYTTWRTVTLKPLFIKQYAEEMLFSYGKKVILMSATILDHRVLCESLGIPIDKVEYIRVPSAFPVENRLIRLRYAGNMNYKEKYTTLPKLVEKIEGGLDIHKNDRGTIHTHSFEITNYIRDNIKRKYLSRLLFQENFPDKDALLKRHSELSNSVIVAPAMHEGLDLKDSLSRFQMICKVPYPDGKNDKQLKERTRLSWQYYIWLTCLKLVQSYGRSVRSETDYANTYILDAQFEKFYKQARKMLPAWFIDAILWH